MTSNFNELEQQRYFSAAARLANKQKISAVEERWLRGYLDRYAPPQAAETGFPEAPSGDARDRNNLRRTNWFNGRYLTAEALSRQDVYFDYRARLNAQALMPGIAWGLGIVGDRLNRREATLLGGGFPSNGTLTLRRGLAFDGVGRPILVSQDFRFSLDDLSGVSLKNPRRVVGGQREFTPCVCLAPDPGGPSGGSAALPSGPYLLVIEAGEVPEGKARVTGDVCGGQHTAPCEADLWQGSFGLSLVRFPVEAPLLNDLPDVWALRGTLSAYYCDVFEHPLWRRWDPAFPVDGSFNRDTGSGRHEGQAIPLALVHLGGEDGSALYIDSWIPRRVISATPGEDWHRTRFGAPPRAAVWARIHQFQTMLQESLAQLTMDEPGEAPRDLHSRGFRHIPPIGFLPVVPKGGLASSTIGTAVLVNEAVRQGRAFFKDTNVVLYGVAALHDDDILEDLSNVIDKDPLQLERRPSISFDTIPIEEKQAIENRLKALSGKGGAPALAFWTLLFSAFRIADLGNDALVNRRTEVVKLIAPLQGLSRLQPLLGAIPEDAGPQAAAWGMAIPKDLGTATRAGRLWNRGGNLLPRSFVVYVKQRLVLLDVVFIALESLRVIINVVFPVSSQSASGTQLQTGISTAGDQTKSYARSPLAREFSNAYRDLPVGDQMLLSSTLDQPVVKELLLQTIEVSTPALARGNRAALFQAQVQEVVNAQPAGTGDALERQRLALAQVADAWAAEYPDVQVIQLLAAVQPPEQTLALVRQLGARPGPVAGPTVADGLELVPPKQFETETSRVLYADVRARLEERPLAELVPDLPTEGVVASLTVGELLARSPQEAEQLLGGAPKLEEVRTAFLRNREDALNAAQGLADGVPRELLARAEAEVGRGVAADEALAKLKEEEAAKPQPDALLIDRIDRSATLLRLGGNRLDVLGGLRRPPGV